MLQKEKLEDIKEFLKQQAEVKATYLYGSYAAGREHSDSDIDIGILLGTEEYSFKQVAEMERSLSERLQEDVDIRVLDDKDTRFLYNVLREGELIFSRDEDTRVSFEYKVMTRYLDLKPFYDEYDRYVRERVTG